MAIRKYHPGSKLFVTFIIIINLVNLIIIASGVDCFIIKQYICAFSLNIISMLCKRMWNNFWCLLISISIANWERDIVFCSFFKWCNWNHDVEFQPRHSLILHRGPVQYVCFLFLTSPRFVVKDRLGWTHEKGWTSLCLP